MTYRPQPIPTGGVALPESLHALSERLAEHNHDVWAKRRMEEGWRYGAQRSDENLTHPDLVPYVQLSESEKQYDRNTVFETLKAIIALGYRIVPPDN
jgi:hypothetical protein